MRKRRKNKRCNIKHCELLIHCTWKNSLKVGTNVSPKADSSVEQHKQVLYSNSSLYFVTNLFKGEENKSGSLSAYAFTVHAKEEQNYVVMHGKAEDLYKFFFYKYVHDL